MLLLQQQQQQQQKEEQNKSKVSSAFTFLLSVNVLNVSAQSCRRFLINEKCMKMFLQFSPESMRECTVFGKFSITIIVNTVIHELEF